MKQLITYDQYLFKIINYGWSNPLFDFLMPWLRNPNTWLPLYLFLILLVLFNYRKTGFWWFFLAVGCVIISDFITGSILKNNVIRLRPCNNPEIISWVHVLVGKRPITSSFASSHASVSFGIATFFYQTLKESFNNWPFLFFFWAFSISFAQVYVGVHYPLDIICGGLIGILIGYLSGKSFNKNYGLV